MIFSAPKKSRRKKIVIGLSIFNVINPIAGAAAGAAAADAATDAVAASAHVSARPRQSQAGDGLRSYRAAAAQFPDAVDGTGAPALPPGSSAGGSQILNNALIVIKIRGEY